MHDQICSHEVTYFDSKTAISITTFPLKRKERVTYLNEFKTKLHDNLSSAIYDS